MIVQVSSLAPGLEVPHEKLSGTGLWKTEYGFTTSFLTTVSLHRGGLEWRTISLQQSLRFIFFAKADSTSKILFVNE